MTLALWIDPADDDAVTLSVGEITAIADKSLEGNDVTAPATGPNEETVEGQRAMTFVSGPLTRVSGSLTNMNGPDFTAIAVFQDDGTINAAGNYEVIVSQSDTVWSADGSGWRIQKPDLVTDVQGSVGGWNGTGVVLNDGDTAGAMKIACLRYDDSADLLIGYENGLVDAAGRQIRSITAGFAHDLHIGEQASPGIAHYSHGAIGDIVYFDGAMTPNQRFRVEGYLSHKWFINNSLPVGHPFKQEGPEIVIDPTVLINFDGADGDTTYTSEDSSARTLTFIGTAALRDTASAFSGTSLDLDGDSDSVTIPHNADLAINTTDDFTFECWFYSRVVTGKTIVDKGGIVGSVWSNYDLGMISDGTIRARIVYLGGVVTEVTSTDTVAANEWHHVAFTWDASADTLELFLDGVSQGTGTSATAPYSGNPNPLRIGFQNNNAAGTHWDGFIDQIRIERSIVYPHDFRPPRRPFRLPPTPANLIVNFTGTDTQSTYTTEDAGARTVTFVNAAEIDTTRQIFGGSSLELNGTNEYVTIPDAADWEFGAGDFTVEIWVRHAVDPGTGVEAYLGQYTSTGDQRGWFLDVSNNLFRFVYSTDGTAGGFGQIDTPFNPVASQWYHLAAERYNDVLTLWIDGIVQAKQALTATIFAPASVLSIGAYGQGSAYLNGHVQGARIFKGRALRSEIRQPERPFTSADSALLCINFDGADAATAYDTDDSVGRTLTFGGTAALSTAERAVGVSSLAVPATSAYVEVPSSADLALGTGDFSIEQYVRFTTLGTSHVFYDQRTGNTSIHPAVYKDASDQIAYYTDGLARCVGPVAVANRWYHVLVERVSGSTRLYVDGVKVGATYADSNDYGQNSIRIGGSWTGVNGMIGYIDGVRTSVGRALYGGDFDVPIDHFDEAID